MTRLDNYINSRKASPATTGSIGGGTTLDKYLGKSGVNTASLDEIKKQLEERNKEQERINKYEQAQQESSQKLEEFRKTQGGIKGTIGKFLGFGVELPKLSAETPEYTAEREASKPKSLGQNVKDFFTEATTESIYDAFYQNRVDDTNLKTIESNNRAINQLAEKNKNEKNEEAKARRQKLINDIYEQNKSIAEDVGGEIAKKTNKQLVGQSLMTALELTPFLGLKEAGTTALKLGIKGATKEVGKETIGKIAGEAAGFGAATGFASGLEQEGATAGSIAKSTAIGGATGGALGFGIGKLGQLFAKKANQRVEQGVIKNIEKKLGKLDNDEADIVREAVTSGTDESVITKQIEDVRKSLDEIYPETKVETPKVETPGGETGPIETPKTETPEVKPTEKQPTKEGTTSKVEATEEVKPKVEEKAKSKFAQRLNEELPENIKIDEEYDVATLRGEADKASNLIEKDKNKAIRIASGIEKSDANTQTATSIALAEKAKETGDWEAVSSLFNQRRLANTRRGQEIAMEKLSIAMNPEERYMKQVLEAKAKKVRVGIEDLKKGETKGVKVDRKVKTETEVFKKDLRQSVKIKEAQSLLDKLTCK